MSWLRCSAASDIKSKTGDVIFNRSTMGASGNRNFSIIDVTDIDEITIISNNSSSAAYNISVYLDGSSTAAYSFANDSRTIDTRNLSSVKIDHGQGYQIAYTVKIKQPDRVRIDMGGCNHNSDSSAYYTINYNTLNIQGFKSLTVHTGTSTGMRLYYNGAAFSNNDTPGRTVPKNSTQYIEITEDMYMVHFIEESLGYGYSGSYVILEK